MPLVEALQADLLRVFDGALIFIDGNAAIDFRILRERDFVRRVILRHEVHVGVGRHFFGEVLILLDAAPQACGMKNSRQQEAGTCRNEPLTECRNDILANGSAVLLFAGRTRTRTLAKSLKSQRAILTNGPAPRPRSGRGHPGF